MFLSLLTVRFDVVDYLGKEAYKVQIYLIHEYQIQRITNSHPLLS